MASPYTVKFAKTAVMAGAAAVEIVNFSDANGGHLAVFAGATDCYFSWAGTGKVATDPTVGGDDLYRVPANTMRFWDFMVPIAQVKIISAGTPTYTVEVA